MMLNCMVLESKDSKKALKFSYSTFLSLMFACRPEEKVVEYYIDCLCFIAHKKFKFVLALFENNAVKILKCNWYLG